MKNSKKRRMKLERYNRLYKQADFKDNCVYCGDKAETKDHVPCLDAAYCLGSSFFNSMNISFLLYPCCRECNSTIGGVFLHTIGERARFIHDKLLKKYNKILSCPSWSDDEIDELERGLVEHVKATEIIRGWVMKRLSMMGERYGIQWSLGEKSTRRKLAS